ncbi:MAG: hypothetical protein AAGF66_10325 [Cyanobacteria bacterium P01_H01_bin.119]
MGKLNNQGIEVVIGANDESLVTDIYQKVEQLSLPAKAALAQHLISTNELTVVVSSRATVDDVIQNMNHIALGNTLDAIADQIRQLDRNSLDLEQ